MEHYTGGRGGGGLPEAPPAFPAFPGAPPAARPPQPHIPVQQTHQEQYPYQDNSANFGVYPHSYDPSGAQFQYPQQGTTFPQANIATAAAAATTTTHSNHKADMYMEGSSGGASMGEQASYTPAAFPQRPQKQVHFATQSSQPQGEAVPRQRVTHDAGQSSLDNDRYAQRGSEEQELGGAPHSFGNVVVEFQTRPPQNTTPLIILVAVSLFGMIPLMSSFALVVLLIGSISMYISDFLGYRRGTIVVIVLSMAAFGSALFISNIHAAMRSFGPMFMILDIMGILTCVIGISVLYFHWIQLAFPELVAVIERTVHGVMPLLSLPSILATITALIGSKNTPFVFSAAMCCIHYGFYGYTPSSFLVEKREIPVNAQRTKAQREAKAREPSATADKTATAAAGESDEAGSTTEIRTQINITGREEALSFTLLLLTLPSLVYIAFQSDFFDNFKTNSMNVIGMVGVPVMYLFLNPKRSLWFVWLWNSNVAEYQPKKKTEDWQLDGVGKALLKVRTPALVSGYLLVLHWAVYRILHSRYQHLFMGVPPPYNTLLMLAIAYAVTFIIYKAKVVLDADERGEDLRPHMETRATIMMASAFASVCFAIVIGAPVSFFPFAVLSATTFNMYLIDRSNSGSLVLFIMFSSMIFLWWMYKTFSFIVVDLRILGDSAVVPTPLVAIGVLWCYVLGWLCFGMSFAESRGQFIVFFLFYISQLTWVEHVLYSQREEGTYPAILVFFTSGVGMWLASRLFKNELISISGAAIVASAFLAKLVTFFVEVTAEYYKGESYLSLGGDTMVGAQVTLSWWAAVPWAYVVFVMEIENRKKVERESVRRLSFLFLASAAVISLCTITNVQRAAYEFFSQQRLSDRNHVHVAIGTTLITFGILTWPFLQRMAPQYPTFAPLLKVARSVVVVGVVALVVQPTQVLDRYQSSLDYEMYHADTGRTFSVIGVALLAVSRLLPMASIPQLVRACFWLCAAVFLSVGLTVSLLPVVSVAISAGVGAYVFLSILTLDVSHYRRLSAQEGWIVYGLSVASMIFIFVMLGRVDLQKYSGGNLLIMWEIHDVGRMHLLAVATAVNLFIAVVLKFRMSGSPLLPHALPLNHDIQEQVGLICNYATFLAVATMTVLNFWGNDNEPGLHVATSLFLLLLVNDNTVFVDLDKRGFRYFPPLALALTLLWGSLVFDAFRHQKTIVASIMAVVKTVLYALPVLPSHVSLLTLLWFGKKKAGTPMAAVVFFVALDVLCLLLSSRSVVQVMAIIGICGQIARLYEAQFWKRRIEVLL